MGYLEDAKARAVERRRKSPWVLLNALLGLVLTCVVGGGAGLMALRVHRILQGDCHPGQDPAGIVIALPLFLSAVPLGLLTSNFVLHLVPPIRRSLDRAGNYRSAQRGLLAVTPWIVVPCVIVTLGALTIANWPWRTVEPCVVKAVILD